MPHDAGTIAEVVLLLLSLGLDTFTVAFASGLGIVVLFGVGVWMVSESFRGDETATVRAEGWRSLLFTSL